MEFTVATLAATQPKGCQHNILPCRLLMYGYVRKNEDFIPDEIIDICIYFSFQELEILLTDYEYLINYSNKDDKQKIQQINNLFKKIRSTVLMNGCPDNYSLISSNNEQQQKQNFYNDTLRGKLWKLMLNLSSIQIDIETYQLNMHQQNDYYIKIRGDTKRTFLGSTSYHSRVDEAQLVRLLNVYINMYPDKRYWAGTNDYAALFLYVMPELYAFYSFSILTQKLLPTYFYDSKENKRTLCGRYASSYLAKDVLKIMDDELYQHLKPLPAHSYLFPPSATLHTICQPFEELVKLWDFMVCFGFYLSPIICVAEIISIKEQIMSIIPSTLIVTILSQRKYLNNTLDSKKVINITMDIICHLKGDDKYKTLWHEILNHASDPDVAFKITAKHVHKSDKPLY